MVSFPPQQGDPTGNGRNSGITKYLVSDLIQFMSVYRHVNVSSVNIYSVLSTNSDIFSLNTNEKLNKDLTGSLLTIKLFIIDFN